MNGLMQEASLLICNPSQAICYRHVSIRYSFITSELNCAASTRIFYIIRKCKTGKLYNFEGSQNCSLVVLLNYLPNSEVAYTNYSVA